MKKIIFLFLLIIVLTGCWDQTEVEDIGFVIGVAFDVLEEEDDKRDTEPPLNYETTFHVAIPSGIETEASGGGGQKQPFFNVSASDATNFEDIRTMDSRRSRKLNFEHLKVIVLSEAIARQGFIDDLLDLYTRDHEMRRRTNVVISTGNAKDVFIDKLPLDETPALSIMKLGENHRRVLQMLKPMEIGHISEKISVRKSYLIPRITKKIIGTDNEIEMDGAAVIRGGDNKMIGWLNEEDVKGFNWVSGEANNGVLKAFYKETPFIFEVLSQDAKITYEQINTQDIFNIHIRAEGAFGETWTKNLEINNLKNIEELEQLLSEEITRQSEVFIATLQNEFHCDSFGFIRKIKHKNYHYWDKIKDEWDGEGGKFEQAKFHITAQVKIRHYMNKERMT